MNRHLHQLKQMRSIACEPNGMAVTIELAKRCIALTICSVLIMRFVTICSQTLTTLQIFHYILNLVLATTIHSQNTHTHTHARYISGIPNMTGNPVRRVVCTMKIYEHHCHIYTHNSYEWQQPVFVLPITYLYNISFVDMNEFCVFLSFCLCIFRSLLIDFISSCYGFIIDDDDEIPSWSLQDELTFDLKAIEIFWNCLSNVPFVRHSLITTSVLHPHIQLRCRFFCWCFLK